MRFLVDIFQHDTDEPDPRWGWVVCLEDEEDSPLAQGHTPTRTGAVLNACNVMVRHSKGKPKEEPEVIIARARAALEQEWKED